MTPEPPLELSARQELLFLVASFLGGLVLLGSGDVFMCVTACVMAAIVSWLPQHQVS